VPGKGWFTLLRLYSPLQSFFEGVALERKRTGQVGQNLPSFHTHGSMTEPMRAPSATGGQSRTGGPAHPPVVTILALANELTLSGTLVFDEIVAPAR
jgi:hypothetical protein